MNKNKLLSGGGENLTVGGKWGWRGKEVGGRGGGKWGERGREVGIEYPLSTLSINTAYIFLRIVKTDFNKGRKACCIF